MTAVPDLKRVRAAGWVLELTLKTVDHGIRRFSMVETPGRN
jgi:hypothetical protein